MFSKQSQIELEFFVPIHGNPAPHKHQQSGTPSKVKNTPKSTHQHAATGSKGKGKGKGEAQDLRRQFQPF